VLINVETMTTELAIEIDELLRAHGFKDVHKWDYDGGEKYDRIYVRA
jgi:hypothetical protein